MSSLNVTEAKGEAKRTKSTPFFATKDVQSVFGGVLSTNLYKIFVKD